MRLTADYPFFIVPQSIFNASLDIYEIGVYACLASFLNQRAGNAWPSYQTIAERLKISKRKVITTVQALQEKGLISIQKRGQKTNLYVLETPTPSQKSEAKTATKSDNGSSLLVHGMHHPSACDAPPLVHGMHHPSACDAPEQKERTIIIEQKERTISAPTPKTEPKPDSGARQIVVAIKDLIARQLALDVNVNFESLKSAEKSSYYARASKLWKHELEKLHAESPISEEEFKRYCEARRTQNLSFPQAAGKLSTSLIRYRQTGQIGIQASVSSSKSMRDPEPEKTPEQLADMQQHQEDYYHYKLEIIPRYLLARLGFVDGKPPAGWVKKCWVNLHRYEQLKAGKSDPFLKGLPERVEIAKKRQAEIDAGLPDTFIIEFEASEFYLKTRLPEEMEAIKDGTRINAIAENIT